jgi:hypothetical protein
MNLPLPDVKGMTDREFILWVCGAVLVYLLLLNPLAINQRLEAVGVLQAQMIKEHIDLMDMAQVQCVNLAELVPDGKMRAKQLDRCLTRKVEAGLTGGGA